MTTSKNPTMTVAKMLTLRLRKGNLWMPSLCTVYGLHKEEAVFIRLTAVIQQADNIRIKYFLTSSKKDAVMIQRTDVNKTA